MERSVEAEVLMGEGLVEIVFRMSETQLRVALLACLGLDQQQIADNLGCSQQAISQALAAMREIAAECLSV